MPRNIFKTDGFRILYPQTCLDCGVHFCTAYPHPPNDGCVEGRRRCRTCQSKRKAAIHGGISRRRSKYGVPYECFDPIIVILERDGWKCQECGVDTPRDKRGSHDDDAPELDHIWPLALIKDGIRSPGHVPLNCQCLCRKCNQKKSSAGMPQLDRSKWRELVATGKVPTFEPRLYDVSCLECGFQCQRERQNAMYCSNRCQKKAQRNRRLKKVGPAKRRCETCGSAFSGKLYKYCSELCKKQKHVTLLSRLRTETKNRLNNLSEIPCQHCKQFFKRDRRPDQVYCSEECRIGSIRFRTCRTLNEMHQQTDLRVSPYVRPERKGRALYSSR